MKQIDCVVIGDILVDIVLHVDLPWEKFSYGGTTNLGMTQIEFGGSGNVAVGLALLGGKVSLIGKAGRDLFGEMYIENLKKNGVIPRVFLDRRSSTGLVLVFVQKKQERSFLVSRGANDYLSTCDIEKSEKILEKTQFVYLNGFSLAAKSQREAILLALEISKKHKKKIIFDPGAHNIIGQQPGTFLKILDDCDILSLNLAEAFAMTKCSNLEDALSKLIERVPFLAIKCGKNGCILAHDKKVIKIPGYNVECLDPTGAGDAFLASLIYGLNHNLSIEDTGKLANWFASCVVSGNGARSYPNKKKIKAFIEAELNANVNTTAKWF
jgi:ribokinase